MANRWGNNGSSNRLYFFGFQNNCSWWLYYEIKRRLLLERIAMTNLDSILKSRDIALSIKVCLVKAVVFPVVMYGCVSWTIKKAECCRIDAFDLWCWRLLRVPLTGRRSSQSILKEISPEYSLEGPLLKLKHQYFGHLMQRNDPLENTLMLDMIEIWRRRGWQRMKWLDCIIDSCPLSQWCHPTISSSVVPFSSCLQYFPASGSFPTSWLVASGGQRIGASASVLPMNIKGWFPLGLTGLISLLYK